MKTIRRNLTIGLLCIFALGAFLTADSGGVLPDLSPVILVAVIAFGGTMGVMFRSGVRPPVGIWSLFRIAEIRERVSLLVSAEHFKRARESFATQRRPAF